MAGFTLIEPETVVVCMQCHQPCTPQMVRLVRKGSMCLPCLAEVGYETLSKEE